MFLVFRTKLFSISITVKIKNINRFIYQKDSIFRYLVIMLNEMVYNNCVYIIIDN